LLFLPNFAFLIPMNKQSRLELIKERAKALKIGVTVLGLISPTKSDTKEEVALVARARDDSDIADEEIKGVKSQLHFDSATGQESFAPLSKSEKKQLIRDVDFFKWSVGKNRNQWLVLVN
jgi:hypothetical protein